MIPHHLTQHRRGVIAGLPAIAVLSLAILWTRPRRFVVEGPSMLPTLRPGDRLLVVRTGRVAIGDLVVLRDPRHRSRLICKRVVSTERRHVVVRGDNPEASTDSRAFGPVPIEMLVGKVVRRYWPPDESQPDGVGRLRLGRFRT